MASCVGAVGPWPMWVSGGGRNATPRHARHAAPRPRNMYLPCWVRGTALAGGSLGFVILHCALPRWTRRASATSARRTPRFPERVQRQPRDADEASWSWSRPGPGRPPVRAGGNRRAPDGVAATRVVISPGSARRHGRHAHRRTHARTQGTHAARRVILVVPEHLLAGPFTGCALCECGRAPLGGGRRARWGCGRPAMRLMSQARQRPGPRGTCRTTRRPTTWSRWWSCSWGRSAKL